MTAVPKPPKERRKRHKQTIACDISPEVRKAVYERDSENGVPHCVVTYKKSNLEIAHFIPRSQGGLGIPENLVVLEKSIHEKLDNGNDSMAKEYIKSYIENYLRDCYPNWDRSKLIYDKWKEIDPAYRFDNSVE